MIKITGSISKGLMARFVGHVFDDHYYFDPDVRYAIDSECHRIARQEFGDLEIFYTESNLGRVEYYDSSQVIVGGIQPNMIVGMLLGAELVPNLGADADITRTCLATTDVASLPAPERLLRHPLMEEFDSQIQKIASDRTADRRPIPPFFWDLSGRAAVHGAMTSGLKLVGDDFFMKMILEPDDCCRLMDWLTDVSLVLVQHFSSRAELPLTGIHVGECAACMIDLESFRKFVVKAASQLGEALGPVRFHSCGKSDHLVTAFAEIQQLQSLDVGGETSVAAIRDQFGPRFPIGIAPLVEDMSADRDDGILSWFERIQRENRDGDLTIGYHLEPAYNLENIRALHRAVVGC